MQIYIKINNLIFKINTHNYRCFKDLKNNNYIVKICIINLKLKNKIFYQNY